MAAIPKFILRVKSAHLGFRTCTIRTSSSGRGLQGVPNPSPSSFTIEEISIPHGLHYKIACKAWKSTTHATRDKEQPPIICVHGWLDNAGSFDTLIPKIMQPGRRFYAIDLPGHGSSSHLATTHYNSHTEAHLAIHRIVRHLGLERFTLLGHSMGAEGCVMYAATFPKGVHKLITIDGVNPTPPDWIQAVQIQVASIFEIEGKSTLPNQEVSTTFEDLLGRIMKVREGMVDEEGCRILLQRGVVKIHEKFRFSHDLKLKINPGLAMITKEQMTDFCAAIEAPSCILKAKYNDIFSEQASADFQTAMEKGTSRSGTKVEFHLVNGNHHVHLNEPDKITPIILNFLNSP